MTARAWLTAMAGTAFIIFVLPYVLAVFDMAPNGIENFGLVALLWVSSWVAGRRRHKTRV